MARTSVRPEKAGPFEIFIGYLRKTIFIEIGKTEQCFQVLYSCLVVLLIHEILITTADDVAIQIVIK